MNEAGAVGAPASAPPGRRGKANIIALSDGTANSSAKLFRTNVWKLYRALDLADPKDKTQPRQFAIYDDGVGSSSFTPWALLGGVFGFGLARNVLDLYAFICRTYRTDDQIYLFGFSRGGFTVRMLAGLISCEGLADYDGDEVKLAAAAKSAFRSYRARRYQTNNALFSVLARLFGVHPKPKQQRAPRIAFIGVWDTVSAYGLPIYELTRAVDKVLWPMAFADRDLSGNVERAMQALAIDEERNTFFPVLWNEGPPIDKDAANKAPPNKGGEATIWKEKLSQVWFPGVHADVGGGYSDDSFSFVPLDWIMKGAHQANLRFLPEVEAEYAAQSDANGPLHNSRKGFAACYRYLPRRIEMLVRDDDKVAVSRIKVHRSVIDRLKDGGDGYAPIILPPIFDVVELDGTISKDVAAVPGAVEAANGRNATYPELREHVFDQVWLRRVVYFPMLFLALVLLAAPFWPDAQPPQDCRRFLSVAYLALKNILPDFSAWWLDALGRWPLVSTMLIALVLCCLYLGGKIETRIRDRMRAVWYADEATRPDAGRPFAPPRQAAGAALTLQQVRCSQGYKAFWKFFRRTLVPWAFGLALVVLVLWAFCVLVRKLA